MPSGEPRGYSRDDALYKTMNDISSIQGPSKQCRKRPVLSFELSVEDMNRCHDLLCQKQFSSTYL